MFFKPAGQDNFRPKVFVNSIPKSGTHLLAQILLDMGINNKNVQGGGNSHDSMHFLVEFGLQTPLEEIEQKMSLLEKGAFLAGHRDYDEEFNNILKENKISHVLIVRDPRDVVVSRTFYIQKRPEHKLFSYYNGLSRRERFIASINGVDSGDMLGITEIYKRFLPWLSEGRCLVVRFEDLVGSRGGGSDEKQSEVLMRIIKHFGITVDKDDLKTIAFKSFTDKMVTFRKGQIGDWVNWLDEEMLTIIREDASIFRAYGYSI
jgi:hypothetical protein